MAVLAERVHAVEEVHLVPRTRAAEPGLAAAVAAWARGAELGTVLAVAARDVRRDRPGDFVRIVKQVADLAEQVAHVGAGSGGPPRRPSRCCPDAASRRRGRRASTASASPATGPGLRWSGPCSPTSRRPSPTTRQAILRPLRHQPRPAGLRPGQPARGGQRGALRPLLAVAPRACAACSSTSSSGDLDISGDATIDATVGLKRAEELYERVFFEYGDDSVAQLGGVHLACEQASNVLTKILEWGRLMAYLEQSTRYIGYDARLPSGHYRYYRPPEILDSPLGARYVGDMDRMFDTYAELLPGVQAWLARRYPRQPGDSDFVYRQAIRAKALDALRGLLPAASLSNVGIYGTGQSYEPLLLRMRAHPLPEARSYAEHDADELRKVIPSFLRRVDSPSGAGSGPSTSADDAATTGTARRAPLARRRRARAAPDGPPEVTPGGLRSRRRGQGPGRHAASPTPTSPTAEALRRVRLLGDDDRAALLAAYVGDRSNRRHRPGRAFERTDYRFELVTDYGAFRDLQRHRHADHRVAAAATALGYDLPERDRERPAWPASSSSRMARSAALYDDAARAVPRPGRLRGRAGVPDPLRHADERPRGHAPARAALGPPGPPRVPAGGPADAPADRRGRRPPGDRRGHGPRRPRRDRPRTPRRRAPRRAAPPEGRPRQLSPRMALWNRHDFALTHQAPA